MKSSRTAVFFIAGLLLSFFLITGCVSSPQKNSSESVDSHSILHTISVTPSQALNKTIFYMKYFPAEIQDEIRDLAGEYSVDISYWGFDPVNNEINFYDYGIQNESILKELRGKKIGEYTIHVMNGTEILNTQDEVQNQLFQLRKDPKNQISHISMITDPLNNPPRYYAEIVCFNSTPENRKLDNMVIKGWQIQVFICCAVPSSTGNSSKSATLITENPMTTGPTKLTNQNITTEKTASPELLDQLGTLSFKYHFLFVHKWEFGPNPDEITLYAYAIKNESQIENLQGTKINNYTIRILHDTEFERKQHELVQKLTLLQQDSRYQIDHFYTVVDPFGNHPEDTIELWVVALTPENRKLDNTEMDGWRVVVYPMSNPLPTTQSIKVNSSNTSS